MPEFITFKKFNDAALAWVLTDLLDENGIEYQTEEAAFSFDPTFGATKELAVEYLVKIKPYNFNRVTELLKASEADDITHIDKDYYLYAFTDTELTEVLEKADEWSSFDHELARKLLTERGIDISDSTLASLTEKRVEELKKSEKTDVYWIVLGYIFSIIGSIIGAFIGWHLAWHKKTLPNGEKFYGYCASDRRHGRIMFYISVAGIIIGVIYQFKVMVVNR